MTEVSSISPSLLWFFRFSRALEVLTGFSGLILGDEIASGMIGGDTNRFLGVGKVFLPGVTGVRGVVGLAGCLAAGTGVTKVNGAGVALAGCVKVDVAGSVGVFTVGGAGVIALELAKPSFGSGIVGNNGMKAFMNFLFRRVSLLDPSNRILYCWNGRASIMTPLLSHFLGEFPS